jgi:multiple sugar transport system ATP-binding protein
VDTGEFKLPIPVDHPAAAGYVGKEVTLGIRPEAIFDAAIAGPVADTGTNAITAKVDVLEPLGHQYVAYLKAGPLSFIASLDNASKVQIDDTARFLVNLNELHLFDNETEKAIR